MKYALFLLSLLFFFSVADERRYDLIIRNGRLLDGAGNPWILGDVGVRKGKITAIGNLDGARAQRIIDAGGQVVAPGFIDVHTHVEGSIDETPTADNFLYDGVTSIITGNCGNSRTDLKGYFAAMEKSGMSLNLASLIGHNDVRRAVLGEENRAPTPRELEQMQVIVRQAMHDGAVGLSTGLIYIPGTFSETAEVVALARAAAEYGGVYASHIRNEDHRVFDAIEEAVNIGREARIPVEISHFKITGKTSWGRTPEMIEMIQRYRAEGIDVTVDQYPYTASSTRLDTQLPSWALADGADSIRARIENPPTREKMISEMKENLAQSGFKNYQWAVVANCPWEERYNGKSIAEINVMRGNPATLDNEIATILDLVKQGRRVQMVYHKMDEEDVRRILRFPLAMIASDAGIPEFGKNMPHPRAYGTNARVLSRYVREQEELPLQEAVRKMTSLPARRFNLHDRGLLLPGYAADIVIFDPATVGDRATFDAPHAYAQGFTYVLVNGVPVIENGKHNGKKPGKVLRNRKM